MNKVTPEDSIKNEFKSRFIELCSTRDFVRHFINFPDEVEKVGFHSYTQQPDIKPILPIKFEQEDERGIKKFFVDYDLKGYFYFFDPRFDGDSLEVKLTYSGRLTEDNQIFDDKVGIR